MEKLIPVSLEEKPVTAFLNFYLNEKTFTNYWNAIYRYLVCFYPGLTRDLDEMDRVATDYISELRTSRNLLNDLAYSVNQMKRQYSPSYVNMNISIVCLWFDDNQVGLTRRIRQRVLNLIPPAYSIREEAELTRHLFKEIYYALPDWCQVLLLFLSGTGLRLGEAMNLKRIDINWEETRPSVYIRAENSKNKISRTAYMTREAAEALKKYLMMRTDNNPFVFPYPVWSAQSALRKAADKTGHGPQNGLPRSFHWHMTRKWFISRFSLAASKEVAEELVGHVGYLSRSYQRFTKQQILIQFKKADSYLSILRND